VTINDCCSFLVEGGGSAISGVEMNLGIINSKISSVKSVRRIVSRRSRNLDFLNSTPYDLYV